MSKRVLFFVLLTVVPGSMSRAFADAVVSDGKFTNVYIYPDPDKETWDEHLKNLPANQKPADWQKFTRQKIDEFTQTLMSPEWPSYFDALHQYGGINPPRFFGSFIASQHCVDAALKDLHDGVLEATTIRSLSNCHESGMDPSPQVNLIFSPDIKIGESATTANGPDICSESGTHAVAFHDYGVNTPNYAVLPTAPGCAPSFGDFTSSFSHEDIEMLSDPANVGHGGAGGSELGDQCENISNVNWKGFTVQRYRSDNDKGCWPLPFPANTATTTWVLGEGSPKIRFTGSVHTFTLSVPARRLVTAAAATAVQIWIQTGGDDLHGGSHAGDNADVSLTFVGGGTVTTNINGGQEWGNGQTHIAALNLPANAPAVKDLQSVTIRTHFGGGLSGDNWDVDKVALMVGFPAGSATTAPPAIVIHDWLNRSGGPLIRFTGSVHNLIEAVPAQDGGKAVSALNLIISTGNDDLRGGNHDGDNCDVTIELANGQAIVLKNANQGGNWKDWTDHSVSIPLPSGGLKGGDVKGVKVHTGFGGGMGGDNWNVQRIQLRATLK